MTAKQDLVSIVASAGWEFYTEPRYDADALWRHLAAAGEVTAGAISPYLRSGIDIALIDRADFKPGDTVSVHCIDGAMHASVLAELALYDRDAGVPRGERVGIPQRDR
ncbi:MAG: hypothetical protein OEU50_23475 [Gammaproteobacteria bacterium]|nr:hypothetical protein [Gammaproteobacteria bacterium]